ncbi:hypothetical protein, partial [Pseudomonas sp. PvP007]|uniref:hypothetical protein n=1 Tax=Pseudomonas sp. PvP007 TaxID=2806583 RepID=UPI001AE24F0D
CRSGRSASSPASAMQRRPVSQSNFVQAMHPSSRQKIPPYNVHICSFTDSIISIFNRYVLARVILLSYDFRI